MDNDILKVAEFYLKLYELAEIKIDEIINFFNIIKEPDKEYQLFYLISNNFLGNKIVDQQIKEDYFFNLGKKFIEYYPNDYTEQDIYNYLDYAKLRENDNDKELTLKIINNTNNSVKNTLNWYINQYAKYTYLRFLFYNIENYDKLKELTNELKNNAEDYENYCKYLRIYQKLTI